ncbi:hypothetical protein L835_3796 [Mycobacteroides abscessus MAB_110811_1470]|nr:hypothetical protein L835_3796 [Mycobacteroides abscessus MAB_110811_1470]
MYQVAADRVDLDGLGEGQLLASLDVQGQDRVGARVAQDGREVMGGQVQVLGVVPWP